MLPPCENPRPACHQGWHETADEAVKTLELAWGKRTDAGSGIFNGGSKGNGSLRRQAVLPVGFQEVLQQVLSEVSLALTTAMSKLISTMKGLTRLLSCVLLGLPLCAQITFRTEDVPRQIAVDSWRAHVDTAGKDVRHLLGAKGGPQRWDFSYLPATGEDVHRMEVVARTDGGHGEAFGLAAYAERVTLTKKQCQTWSYFKVIPGVGRFYYGFYEGCKTPPGDVVFDLATIDLPADIAFGQSWQREVTWRDVIDAGFIVLEVAIHFTNETVVDAYGTVVLPEIGEVPALRLNEVNTYVTKDLTFDIPIDAQVVRNYVWLVPGIGKAVHIISEAGLTAPPEDFAMAKTVLRVFECGQCVPPPPPCEWVRNPRLRLLGQDWFLTWDRFDWAKAYQIETCTGMSDNLQWELLREVPENYTLEKLAQGEVTRFFRVKACRP